MRFSDLKVGTRLSAGFLILLAITVIVGGVGLMRLSQLDRMKMDNGEPRLMTPDEFIEAVRAAAEK